MYTIQESINQWLIDRGVISNTASVLDNTIMLLFIILITVAIDYICRYIFLNMFKRLAKKTRNQWDDLIVERKIINKLMHIIPAVLVYVLLPLAFPQAETPKLLDLLQMVCKIYIIAVSLRFINASLNVVLEIYNRKESFKNKPLKGFIQLLQVGVYFVAVILIVSVIIDKSAASLFAGLGASAAVLMLVFRAEMDTFGIFPPHCRIMFSRLSSSIGMMTVFPVFFWIFLIKYTFFICHSPTFFLPLL